MSISATDPIGLAMSRTGRMLFKPFDIKKWFVLGFAVKLDRGKQGRRRERAHGERKRAGKQQASEHKPQNHANYADERVLSLG